MWLSRYVFTSKKKTFLGLLGPSASLKFYKSVFFCNLFVDMSIRITKLICYSWDDVVCLLTSKTLHFMSIICRCFGLGVKPAFVEIEYFLNINNVETCLHELFQCLCCISVGLICS